MTDRIKIRAFIYLHIAVFLWGFTAILGKLISYGSLVLVWQRMCFAAIVYFMFPALWKHLKKTSKKDIFLFLGIGAIVCAHWLTFYGSIKLGNSASITLACLGTVSFFTAILEPLLLKKRIKMLEIFLGILVLGGICIIYLSLPVAENSEMSLAILTGIVSAFLASLFSALNKKNIEKTHVLALSALEMAGGAILLSLVILIGFPDEKLMPEFNINSGNYDIIWIMLLVLVCTNFTFYLAAHSLQFVSAFTANLTVNLEPVYGMILGAVIFQENRQLNVWFYLGASLILISVFLQTFLEYYKKRNTAEKEAIIIRE